MSRSQQELEQPAKMYQLNAVETKVDTALKMLDTIVTQTAGLVTADQLAALKLELENKIAAEIKDVHKEYSPMKKNLGWFVKLVIANVTAIVIVAFFALYDSVKG